MPEVADAVPKIIEAIFSQVPEPFETFDITIKPLENSRSFWSECYQVLVSSKTDKYKDKVVSPLFVKLFKGPQCTRVEYLTGYRIPRISDITTACDPGNTEQNTMILKSLTARETMFYNDFKAVIFPGFPIPRCYYGESLDNEEMAGLVCEDLSGTVYSLDFVPGFTDTQVIQLLDSLAYFHAATIKMKEDISWENYENSLYDQAYIRMLYNDTLEFEQLCPTELAGRIQAVKHAFDENGIQNSESLNEELGMPVVLCHNDLNASNILWNNENKQVQAFIDFQHASRGSITFDIIRVLSLGLSAENRRSNTERYLHHYYNTFKGQFKDCTAPFTIGQLHKSYRAHFNFVNSVTLFSLSYYYKMYKDDQLNLKEEVEIREDKAAEILRRTLGILEDIQ